MRKKEKNEVHIMQSSFVHKIEDQATALQYALDVTSTYDENRNRTIHMDKAKELFDFICTTVNLPSNDNTHKSAFIDLLKNTNNNKTEFEKKCLDLLMEIRMNMANNRKENKPKSNLQS